MNFSPHLDAYAKPPAELRELYKKYQAQLRSLEHDFGVVDFSRGLTVSQQTDIKVIGSIGKERLTSTFDAFVHGTRPLDRAWDRTSTTISDVPIYEHRDLPGLHIIPSLLPPNTQLRLLHCLLHRDLSNPLHNTNVHAHYKLQYLPLEATVCGDQEGSESLGESYAQQMSPKHASFFTLDPNSSQLFEPKDAKLHKPLSVSRFLDRKLRWITLGGQYDWTNKMYPTEPPPAFPTDIADLLAGIFPDTKAQAAIVNLYSPGDTLSVHRDVSEDCDQGLVSMSLGCDGVFIIGMSVTEDDGQSTVKHVVLRLRSGDAVYMSGPSRFAWHGVPQIVGGTCPEWLRPWPAKTVTRGNTTMDDSEGYSLWRNWMETKRINLNVRQMTD